MRPGGAEADNSICSPSRPLSLSPSLFQLICPFSRSACEGRRNDSPRLIPCARRSQVTRDGTGVPEEPFWVKPFRTLKTSGPTAWTRSLWDIQPLQDGTVEQSFGGGLVVGMATRDRTISSPPLLSSTSPISPLFHVGKLASMRASGLEARCSADLPNIYVRCKSNSELSAYLSHSKYKTRYAPS